MWTTQPSTRAGSIASRSRPSGSPADSRVPRQRSPRPWKNHQGTPFIADSTTVSGPSSGAIVAGTEGSAVVFTLSTTRSWGPSSAG